MPCAQRVKARVLVKSRGQQPRGEIGIVGFIEEAAPCVGIESAYALAEGGVHIHAFCSERSEAQKDEGGIIRGLLGGDSEVVLPSGWMRLCSAGDGTEIGHEAEDALRLPALERNGIAVRINGNAGIDCRAGAGVWVA